MNSVFKNKQLRYLLLVAVIVLTLEIMGVFNRHLPSYIEIPLFIIIILVIGGKVLLGGVQSLLKLDFSNISLLMTIAVIGAILLGEWEEASVIVALFAASEKLEDLGVKASQSSIESLIAQTPKLVTMRNGEKKAIEEVTIHEIFIVKPGDTIGLDGEVVKGVSNVDESAITGEPIPSEKLTGSKVFAGTVNMQGFLEVRVEKISSQSVVQRIVELTSKATANKANYQKFIEKFSQYYTPTVFVIALLIVLVPTLFFSQPFADWFERGITLLLIACPCALVISTPISIFSAVGNASSSGILVKGGRFLEEIGKVKLVAFDKTRTLTLGKPIVKEFYTLNGVNKNDALACAASIESFSEHPLSHAITEYTKGQNISTHSINKFKAIVGKGVEADCLTCNSGSHIIGSVQFILDNKYKIPSEVQKIIDDSLKIGDTPIILADEKGVKGIFVLSDQIRDESQKLINDLHRLGIHSAILTGDNEKTANYVAKKLCIDKHYGKLLPDQKVTKLKDFQKQYKTVAMVGDGVNDAPVLATSDIGIAMGAVGSDIAIESADIALMNDNISLIPSLIKLGRYTSHTIQFNIILALITKTAALILASLGYIGLGIAIFADVGVTMVVILISLNIMNFKFNS